ncbi:MAG: amidohydrolase family protein [Verrucomicrobiota bacterium]
MRLDSHQHFWAYNHTDYPWIPKDSSLARDWLPHDLLTIQKPLDFDGSIAIQARQSIEESSWLLSLADRTPEIRGVVGWVDLRSKQVEEQLALLALHPKFVGVRHVIEDEQDEQFLLRPEFVHGISKLSQFGLAYDLLIRPHQIAAATELVAQLPEQRFVLDHLAKPQIKDQIFFEWHLDICELAKMPNVCCKVSGLITEADHKGWHPDDFIPYLDRIFEYFGPDRIMFGSDWPVCLLAGDYGQVFELINQYTAHFPEEDRVKLFGTNALRFYFPKNSLRNDFAPARSDAGI